MPVGWRLFRALCFFLLLASGLEGVFSLLRLFYGHFGTAFLGLTAYTIQYFFLLMGLSLLNNHYPDTSLSRHQKSRFNLLFVANFMVISFFFARLVAEIRSTLPVLLAHEDASIATLLAGYSLYSASFIFLGHLLFLYGMFMLRRHLHRYGLNKSEASLDSFEEEQ
jgi:hypothetical protein